DVPAKILDPLEAHFDDAPPDKLWGDLGSENDLRLQIVLKAFRAAPKQTVDFIAMKVPPITKEHVQQVEKVMADLDDEAVAKRDDAMKELQGLAHQFASLMQKKLAQAPAGEIRNRLTLIIDQMEKQKPPPALVTQLR